MVSGHTAFLAEWVFGNVVPCSIKFLVLAVALTPNQHAANKRDSIRSPKRVLTARLMCGGHQDPPAMDIPDNEFIAAFHATQVP